MATSNFYYKNYLYVIGTQEEGAEEEYFLIVEDTIENIRAEVTKYKNGYFSDFEIDEYPISRNFGGRIIAKFEHETDKYTYRVNIVLYNGYYSNCNLDIQEEFISNDINVSDEEAEGNLKSYKYQDVMYKRAIKIVEKYTTEYLRVATFSNGETIYKKK